MQTSVPAARTNRHLNRSLGFAPALRAGVPDRQIVPGDVDRDDLRLAGSDGDVGESLEDRGGLASGCGEVYV